MKKLRITVGDKSYDVTVEVLSDDAPSRPASATPSRSSDPQPVSPAPRRTAPPPGSFGAGAVTSPLAGVIISLLVKEGDEVAAGQELVILEAMKMENQITAPTAGKVKSLHIAEGESVPEGHLLLVVE